MTDERLAEIRAYIDGSGDPEVAREMAASHAKELLAEIDRLRAERAERESILRASVPEEFDGCTSPVGAVQGYIATLEQAVGDAEAIEAAVELFYGERFAL